MINLRKSEAARVEGNGEVKRIFKDAVYWMERPYRYCSIHNLSYSTKRYRYELKSKVAGCPLCERKGSRGSYCTWRPKTNSYISPRSSGAQHHAVVGSSSTLKTNRAGHSETAPPIAKATAVASRISCRVAPSSLAAVT